MTDTNYLTDFKPGTVVLAGAGPGDAALLTLAAAEALRRADVVIYDALVGNAVMDLIPQSAEGRERLGLERENWEEKEREEREFAAR